MLQAVEDVCKKNHIEYFLGFGTLLGAIRHKGFIPWDNDMDVWITRDNFEKLWACRDQLPEGYVLVPPDGLGNGKYFDCIPHLYYKYVYIDLDPAVVECYGKLKNCLNLDFFFLESTYKGARADLQRLELCILSGLLGGWRHKATRERYPFPFSVPITALQAVGRGIPLRWLMGRYAKVASRYNTRSDADACFSSNGHFVKYLFPKQSFDKADYAPFETTEMPIPGGYDEVLKVLYGDYMRCLPPEERHFHWSFFTIKPEDYVFIDQPLAEGGQ